jgi:hypothetical protein
MRRLWHCASFLFVLVLFSAGVTLAENTHFNCVPSFPFQQEWQGADAAYSIPLQDGRVAWIFGDTLYGDARLVTGEEPRMVHNTIGISTCKDGEWKIDYAIKKDAKGNPDSFFSSMESNTTLDTKTNSGLRWSAYATCRTQTLLRSASRSAEPISPT